MWWRILFLVFLTACSSQQNRAPVEERNAGYSSTARTPAPSTYSVTRGDTLYAIAWRFGFDYRKLARANGIPSPYTIFPGQRIKLTDKVLAGSTISSSSAKAQSSSAAKSKTVTKSSSPPAKISAGSTAKPSNAGLVEGPIKWRWPTSGKVVRGFSGDVHKGIDIGGVSGDPINAVAPGRVVYAGNGIVGYGNLLIVKHNEEYLSAYAHNRLLLVAENDVVKSGQKIAEKGDTATNSVKLHFEIRREGKPIDPQKLLPRR